MLRRTLLTGGALAALAGVAQARSLGRIRMARRGGGGATPPPAGDLAMTVRTTWGAYVDLGSALSAIHPGNMITLSVSGAASAKAWPDRLVTNGQTAVFVHRELLYGNLRAETSGASEGSGVWTFMGKAGADGTGATVTVTLVITISDAPVLSYTIGQRTLAGFGGYPIHEHLPGAAYGYSIAAQSAAGAFQIVNADTSDPATATQRFLTWAGTYGSTTRTVGTPTLGAAAYWVDLTNGSTTYRITFDVLVDELNCAPNAQMAAAGQSNQILQTVAHATLAKYYGDRYVCEAGDYTNSGSGSSTITLRNATVRSGGPAKPTTPFLNGYKPEDDRHPGWLTIMPRRPQTVNFPANVTISFAGVTGYAGYHRLLDLRFSGASGLLTVNNTPADKNHHWLAVDRCRGKTNIGGKLSCTNMFVWDCYVKDLAGAITVIARDSQIVGCVGDGIDVDFINFGICNTTTGNGRSWLAWNHTKNKKKSSDTAHPDHIQGLFLPGDANFIDAQAAGTVLEMPYIVGNVLALGEPSRNGSGQGREGGHLIFINDVRSDLLYLYRIAMNVLWDATPQGIWISNGAPGTKVRNNTLQMNNGVAPGAPGQVGQPYLRGNAILGMVCEYEFKDNVASAGVSNGYDAPDYPPTAVITSTNNITDIDQAAEQAAAFADPLNYAAITSIQDVIDRLTPKAGSQLTVAGGAPRLVGAIGHPSTLIDFRRRVIDEAAVFA